jgi:hypothetical protein
MYKINEKSGRKMVAILPHQSSNDEQSTPLNLAKENPRLKSQSVNSSSAKGKGAIPTDGCWLAGLQAVSVTLGSPVFWPSLGSVSPFWAPATTPQQMQSIQSTNTPGETTQFKRAYALSHEYVREHVL